MKMNSYVIKETIVMGSGKPDKDVFHIYINDQYEGIFSSNEEANKRLEELK